jgi:hypothetical protein
LARPTLLLAAGLLACFFTGYAVTKIVLSRHLTFLDYSANQLADANMLRDRIYFGIASMFGLFGGLSPVPLKSLDGAVSVLNCLLLLFLFCVAGSQLRRLGSYTVARQRLILFFWINFGVNMAFLFLTSINIAERYHITTLTFAYALLALLIDELEASWLKRAAAVSIAAICVLGSQLRVAYGQTFLRPPHRELRSVIHYLKENQYDFGYATFWHADLAAVLSNGNIELANIFLDGQPHHWVTPKRYYDPKYHPGKTFVLLTREESAQASPQLLKQITKAAELGEYLVYRREGPLEGMR